jgi:hypothetical protein
MRVGLRAPSPATIQRRGGRGGCARDATMASTVSMVGVGGPIRDRQDREVDARKGIALKGFRWWQGEKRMVEDLRQEALIEGSALGGSAILIARQSRARAREIVQQGIARSGIKGQQLARPVDIGRVGNAADIENRDRLRSIHGGGERATINRHQRRPLAARRDVGRPEIIRHRQASWRASAGPSPSSTVNPDDGRCSMV